MATQSEAQWFDGDWFRGLLLVVAVLLVYTPVLHAGFVWDDDDHVTANPCIVGPLGFKEIWTTNHARYYPLVTTTFWLEHKLWGLTPGPYHFFNVLVHAADGVVLWRVLRILRVEGAWLGASLWALHPVSVETVAWITELKNAQSCLFYLLSIFFFVKAIEPDGLPASVPRRCYCSSLFFAALAMASKSSAVVLPLVLGLCAWWMEGRWRWRNLALLAPVFLMSVAAALLAMWTVDLQGVNADREWLRSWPERLVTAGDVIWFYLAKLAWPDPLIFIYPRWTIGATRPLSFLPLLLALGLLLGFARRREPGARACFFALAYFIIALLPVLGLVEHYFLRYSFVADHLQYLASMGPLALAGAGLTSLAMRIMPGQTRLRIILAASLLGLLGIISGQRTWVFQNQATLWSDTLAKNPDCWLAYNNLAGLLLETGHAEEAIADYQAALKIKPDLFDTKYNLGNAYVEEGHPEDAVRFYRAALALHPADAAAHINLGFVLSSLGRWDEAISEERTGLRINPGLAQGHYLLGNALRESNRIGDAIDEYREAIALDPGQAKAHNNLGIALAQMGRPADAVAEFEQALLIDPGFAAARRNLAVAQAAGRAVPVVPAAK